MRALVFLLLALVGAAAAASVAAQGSLRQASPLAEEGQGSCHKWRTRKSTLKLIKETPFSGLFRDLKNSTEFEASGGEGSQGAQPQLFPDTAYAGGGGGGGSRQEARRQVTG